MVIEVTYNVTDVYMSTTVSPIYITVDYSGSGGSGASVWGSITGTLSNQTDLQTALDGKFDDPTGTTSQYLRGDGSLATFPSLTGYVPYSGATSAVDLGEYGISAGQVTLDVSPTGTAAVGTTQWNDTIGSSQTTLKGGSVVLKNGVDLVARIVNKVSPNTTLTKAAYQAVRVSGAQGQRLAVAFAQANNDNNSADTIGLVIETIATNQEGFIITVGQIDGINTTGSLQGETWADGDVLYLSPTVAGALTNVKPTGATGHIVIIGYVEYAHANNGKIYVKVMNGWELDELHNVYISSVANNQGLFYESSSSLWKNKSISTVLGYTPEQPLTFSSPLSRSTNTVSIPVASSSANGYLSSTDWSTFNNKQNALTNPVTGTGTSNELAYFSGTSAISSLTTATYPSLTELSYVKGVTSAVQTQLNAKQGTITLTTTGTSGAATLVGNTLNIPQYSGGGGMAIGGSITSATAGSVLFAGTSGVLAQDNSNLFWDNTNKRLGIGTATPTANLSVVKNADSANTFYILNSSTGTSARNLFLIGEASTGGTYGYLSYINSGYTSSGLLTPNTTLLASASTGGLTIAAFDASGTIKFGAGNATSAMMTLTATGTLRFNSPSGSNNTYLEGYSSSGNISAQIKEASTVGSGGLLFNGQRIDNTNGSAASFNGYVGTTASGNTSAIVFNGIGGTIASPADLPTGIPIAIFAKRSGGVTVNQMALFQTGNLLIQNGGTFTDVGYRLDVNGTMRVQSNATFGTIATGTGMYWDNTNNRLGIGTGSPTNVVDITKSLAGDNGIIVTNTSNNVVAQASLNVKNDVGTMGSFKAYSSTFFVTSLQNMAAFGSTTNIALFTDAASASGGTGHIKFLVGGYDASQERLRIKSTGQVRFVPLSSAPSSPQSGDVYYDSTTNKLRCYDGTIWNDLF